MISEAIDHVARLPHRFIMEGGFVGIAPLQRKILPDHEPDGIGHIVELRTLQMRVDADGIQIRGTHHLDVAGVPTAVRLREPLRADVVGSARIDSLSVEAPYPGAVAADRANPKRRGRAVYDLDRVQTRAAARVKLVEIRSAEIA